MVSNESSHRGVAVVTGSSSGIGRAIAIQLAGDGFDVIVHCAKSLDAAKQVAGEIESLGRQSLIEQQDFESVESLAAFVDRCWAWQDRIDVWVNNAGADVLTGEAGGWSFTRKLQHVLSVDVVATLLLTKTVGQQMNAAFTNDNRRRSIINIGWDQAENGMAGDSGEMFAASKGAIMAASKSFAQSLAPAVRVNCIAPGWIQTAWGEEASQEWQQRAHNESLSNRWGQASDVAAAASFLASENADFINGQVIKVNGGFRFGQQT